MRLFNKGVFQADWIDFRIPSFNSFCMWGRGGLKERLGSEEKFCQVALTGTVAKREHRKEVQKKHPQALGVEWKEEQGSSVLNIP